MTTDPTNDVDASDVLLSNDRHEPAGTPKGGQFAPKALDDLDDGVSNGILFGATRKHFGEAKFQQLKDDIAATRTHPFEHRPGDRVQSVDRNGDVQHYIVRDAYIENGEPRYLVYPPGKSQSAGEQIWLHEHMVRGRTAAPGSTLTPSGPASEDSSLADKRAHVAAKIALRLGRQASGGAGERTNIQAEALDAIEKYGSADAAAAAQVKAMSPARVKREFAVWFGSGASWSNAEHEATMQSQNRSAGEHRPRPYSRKEEVTYGLSGADASDVLRLDRGKYGDEGHYVTVDGHKLFIVDDHGTGANGKGGSFTKHGLEKKLVKHHEERGGNWAQQHREILAEGSGHDLHGPAKFTFHRELPGEVLRHIENNPAARRLFKVTPVTDAARGADALASMGEKYWDLVDEAAGGHITKALATAEKSDDPEARFHAALYREYPNRKGAQGIVPADKLREGQTFTINGRAFEVVDREDGNGLTLDGGKGFPETPVAALSEIPIDKHSMKAPKARRDEDFDVPDDDAMDGAGLRDLRGDRSRRAARAPRRFKNDDVAPFSREGELTNGVYLSVDASMAPAVTIGQGFPATFNELPVHYRDVQATVCGTYTHPVTGKSLEITPARVKNIARNVNAMLARKIDVPASKTHKFTNPDNTLGNVFAAREKGGELVLTVGYYGDAALDVARKNKVSLGLCSNYLDALGNTYDDTINHLAITPVPVLPGLPGFVTLSLDSPTPDDSGITNPPATAGKKGVAMLSDTMKARVAAFTGKDVGDDVDAAMLAVLEKAEPATAQVATLSRELAEAKTTTLANEPADDPRYAGLAYRTLRAEVDADVAKGDYSRHTGDAYLSLYEVEKGKPNVTLLSREDDSSPLAPSRIRELLKLARPGLRGRGESTPAQTLHLSREVPDATPDEPNVQDEVNATLAMTSLGQRALATQAK